MTKDEEMKDHHEIILKGWPENNSQVPHSVRGYWAIRDELTVVDGLI
jgi:hypothetical protein